MAEGGVLTGPWGKGAERIRLAAIPLGSQQPKTRLASAKKAGRRRVNSLSFHVVQKSSVRPIPGQLTHSALRHRKIPCRRHRSPALCVNRAPRAENHSISAGLSKGCSAYSGFRTSSSISPMIRPTAHR
jgi:hypothetical protein